jgi:hypothetical protein
MVSGKRGTSIGSLVDEGRGVGLTNQSFNGRPSLPPMGEINCEPDRDRALTLFGELIHPIMDSFSPIHVDQNGNPQVWDILNPGGHSPNEYVGNERVIDITPEIYQKSKEAMIDAYIKAFPPR